MSKRKIIHILILLVFFLISYAFEQLSSQTKDTSFPTPTSAVLGVHSDATVVKVVDGDTIDILKNNNKERIRLLGINTPETVDPRKSVQCFGEQASNKAKELLENKSIKMESDPTQGDKDKYGRLLRYIYLENGTFVNLVLIQEGFAYEYTYDTPYKFQKEFKAAQKNAEAQKKGLWGIENCSLTPSK